MRQAPSIKIQRLVAAALNVRSGEGPTFNDRHKCTNSARLAWLPSFPRGSTASEARPLYPGPRGGVVHMVTLSCNQLQSSTRLPLLWQAPMCLRVHSQTASSAGNDVKSVEADGAPQLQSRGSVVLGDFLY